MPVGTGRQGRATVLPDNLTRGDEAARASGGTADRTDRPDGRPVGRRVRQSHAGTPHKRAVAPVASTPPDEARAASPKDARPRPRGDDVSGVRRGRASLLACTGGSFIHGPPDASPGCAIGIQRKKNSLSFRPRHSAVPPDGRRWISRRGAARTDALRPSTQHTGARTPRRPPSAKAPGGRASASRDAPIDAGNALRPQARRRVHVRPAVRPGALSLSLLSSPPAGGPCGACCSGRAAARSARSSAADPGLPSNRGRGAATETGPGRMPPMGRAARTLGRPSQGDGLAGSGREEGPTAEERVDCVEGCVDGCLEGCLGPQAPQEEEGGGLFTARPIDSCSSAASCPSQSPPARRPGRRRRR